MSYFFYYRPMWDFGVSQVSAVVYGSHSGGTITKRKKKKRTDYKAKISEAMHPKIEIPTAEAAGVMIDEWENDVVYFIDEL